MSNANGITFTWVVRGSSLLWPSQVVLIHQSLQMVSGLPLPVVFVLDVDLAKEHHLCRSSKLALHLAISNQQLARPLFPGPAIGLAVIPDRGQDVDVRSRSIDREAKRRVGFGCAAVG